MKKLEIKLGLVIMLISLMYYYLTYSLPEKVVLYPRFVAILLFTFSLMFLIQTAVTEYKDSVSPFQGIYWRQLIFVLAMSMMYIMLINVLGFFLATSLYVVVTMRGLKIKILNAVLSTIGVNAALYGIFVFFLNVPLPTGILF